MAVVDTLTKHFCKRWSERVGAQPSIDGVNRIICGAKKIRAQSRLWRRDGGMMLPVKILAMYWNHRSGVVILVDEDLRRAVTVISANE